MHFELKPLADTSCWFGSTRLDHQREGLIKSILVNIDPDYVSKFYVIDPDRGSQDPDPLTVKADPETSLKWWDFPSDFESV